MSEFTAKQDKELDDRAEKRDLSRPRKSTFSIGEQGELDETANTLRVEGRERARQLGFNALQEADLTHRFNEIKLNELAQFGRRALPFLLATLLLILGVLDFAWQQDQTQQTRSGIIALCQTQQKVDCKTLFK